MPATQISFADFALSLSSAFFPPAQAAAPSTPPVQQTAVEVVAYPLAVDGGECTHDRRARRMKAVADRQRLYGSLLHTSRGPSFHPMYSRAKCFNFCASVGALFVELGPGHAR